MRPTVLFTHEFINHASHTLEMKSKLHSGSTLLLIVWIHTLQIVNKHTHIGMPHNHLLTVKDVMDIKRRQRCVD